MNDRKRVGITAKKSEDFSEWYSQICSETGANLADVRHGVKGCIVHRPWGLKILREINDMLEREVEKMGHEPVLFPTLIPEANLRRESQHVEGFIPEVFWVTEGGGKKLEERLALRPTGETAFYPMYALWIQSYRDLPFRCYQSRITNFRYEMSTRPFLRGREFMFFETHDVFATHDEAMDQIRKDMEMSKEVFWGRFGIPHIFFRRPAWDRFAGAEETYAADTVLPDGQRIQMGSTHDLGQGFARAFDVKFLGRDGRERFGWQTCWGPGIWRVFAALVSIHGDDRGLRLPFALAPIQIVIVPIARGKSEAEKADEYARDLADVYSREGYRCHVDDTAQTPGFKFNQWEMQGVPVRIEVGPREVTQGHITLALRVSGKKLTIPRERSVEVIAESIVEEFVELQNEAREYFDRMTATATSMEGLAARLMEKCGFVKIPLCAIDTDGEECADAIKTATNGGQVSGIPLESVENPEAGMRCTACGRDARHIAYVARSI